MIHWSKMQRPRLDIPTTIVIQLLRSNRILYMNFILWSIVRTIVLRTYKFLELLRIVSLTNRVKEVVLLKIGFSNWCKMCAFYSNPLLSNFSLFEWGCKWMNWWIIDGRINSLSLFNCCVLLRQLCAKHYSH